MKKRGWEEWGVTRGGEKGRRVLRRDEEGGMEGMLGGMERGEWWGGARIDEDGRGGSRSGGRGEATDRTGLDWLAQRAVVYPIYPLDYNFYNF